MPDIGAGFAGYALSRVTVSHAWSKMIQTGQVIWFYFLFEVQILNESCEIICVGNGLPNQYAKARWFIQMKCSKRETKAAARRPTSHFTSKEAICLGAGLKNAIPPASSAWPRYQNAQMTVQTMFRNSFEILIDWNLSNLSGQNLITILICGRYEV